MFTQKNMNTAYRYIELSPEAQGRAIDLYQQDPIVETFCNMDAMAAENPAEVFDAIGWLFNEDGTRRD